MKKSTKKNLLIVSAIATAIGAVYMYNENKKKKKSLALNGATANSSSLVAENGTSNPTATSRRAATFASESSTPGICQSATDGSTYFSNPIRGTKNGCKPGDSTL